jgi:hypothetical protein
LHQAGVVEVFRDGLWDGLVGILPGGLPNRLVEALLGGVSEVRLVVVIDV